MTDSNVTSPPRATTGVQGLDDVLNGGFPEGVIHLLEGDPGTGKTTLGIQFLLEGLRQGQTGLFVSLSSRESELDRVFQSHGWSKDGITILDLAASQETLQSDHQYTVFHPAEVELSETTNVIIAAMESLKPARVVFDAISEMRLLARDPLRFRRQIWALKDYFGDRGCTVLLLDYPTAPDSELQLHSLSSGVVSLEQLTPEYGGQRRRLRVEKMRSVAFRDGYHDYKILTGGVNVYPRLAAVAHAKQQPQDVQTSGVAELDALLGGGISLGTSTLIMGPAGSGKSTIAAQFLGRATALGRKAAAYLFDESMSTLMARGERLGFNFFGAVEEGTLEVQQIDPAEMSPGEFAEGVQAAVNDGVSVVIIDNLNGYCRAMPEDTSLTSHVHELMAYLNDRGVMTILIVAQLGIMGPVESPVDVSYLSDNVMMIRYFEFSGDVKKAISVVKKRSGQHETTVRELRLTDHGIDVGPVLTEFTGVLSGQLTYTGGSEDLIGGGVERA